MSGVAATHIGALVVPSNPWRFVGTVTWHAGLDPDRFLDNQPVDLRLALAWGGLDTSSMSVAFTTTGTGRAATLPANGPFLADTDYTVASHADRTVTYTITGTGPASPGAFAMRARSTFCEPFLVDGTWTVPAGVLAADLVALGANGGLSTYNRGRGGRVDATFSTTPAETIVVKVGTAGTYMGGGTAGAGGSNGGGNGGRWNSGGGTGGGGGAADLRRSGGALADRFAVAGGGGGKGGGSSGYTLTPPSRTGGNGGGLTAEWGQWGSNALFDNGEGGGGGAQTGPTAAGDHWATDGTLGQGGTGGDHSGVNGGGGGGGGYWGGGGGGAPWSSWTGSGGGGGGGSSYTDGSCSAVVHTQGYNTGNGQVTISW